MRLRFAPSPTGFLHIGGARTCLFNWLYARKLNGQFILRIEDTNAGNIYSDSYELIPEDTNWLTEGNVDEVIIQSDRMELYYDFALKLIEENNMYVCTCDPEEFKEMIKGSGKKDT